MRHQTYKKTENEMASGSIQVFVGTHTIVVVRGLHSNGMKYCKVILAIIHAVLVCSIKIRPGAKSKDLRISDVR